LKAGCTVTVLLALTFVGAEVIVTVIEFLTVCICLAGWIGYTFTIFATVTGLAILIAAALLIFFAVPIHALLTHLAVKI